MSTLNQKPLGNLPTALSTFIGRTHEINDVKELVSTNRLVTLTGTGGSGKTPRALMVAHDLMGESLSIRRQHGHKWGVGASLSSLGWVTLLQHDYPRMQRSLAESLSVRREIGDQGGIAWCLEKLAVAKMEQSQFQDAAKIFGCAEALRAPIGSVIDPADQPEYTRILSGLQSALDMEAFAALWTEGKATALAEIISCAVSDSASSPRSEKEKFNGLTPREREVAAWIAQGKSNREIAEVITVSVKTIETYVTRILNKLGFDSGVQIATWAVEKGLAVHAREPHS